MSASSFPLSVILVLGSAAVAFPTGVPGQVIEHRSAVFVVVDLSQTWHRSDTRARNEALFRRVNEGVVALTGRIERPTYVAFSGIGSEGLAQNAICRASYHPTLLSGGKRVTLNKQSDLVSFLADCSKGALALPSASWTDVSGALDFLGRQLGEGQDRIERYAVLLSDMKEERSKRGIASLNLKGFKILIVYRALLEDDKFPMGLQSRLDDWRKRLTSAGATTTMVIDTGLVPQAIADLAYDKQ